MAYYLDILKCNVYYVSFYVYISLSAHAVVYSLSKYTLFDVQMYTAGRYMHITTTPLALPLPMQSLAMSSNS